MKEPRNYVRVFFILTAFGLMSLVAMISRPTLANLRAVDFIHLIATGMCFGGAIVALAAYFRHRH